MKDLDPVGYHFDQTIIWHVIFHPGKSLWSRRFSHVSLAGFSNETWLHLDVQLGGVNVASIFHHDEVKDYLTFLLAHYTVVRFGSANALPARTFFAPLTCVSFVKHTLRFRSCALRPDPLFKHLLREDNVKVLNETQGSGRDGGAEAAAD